MSERFTRLYSLPEVPHSEGSPVTVAAGALLKDNTTGDVLAQLKFQNLGNKAIKALKVQIVAKDVAGNPLGGPIEHQYLDFNASNGEFFGQKTAIFFPNDVTRSYDVSVLEVIFADNTVWTLKAEVKKQKKANGSKAVAIITGGLFALLAISELIFIIKSMTSEYYIVGLWNYFDLLARIAISGALLFRKRKWLLFIVPVWCIGGIFLSVIGIIQVIMFFGLDAIELCYCCLEVIFSLFLLLIAIMPMLSKFPKFCRLLSKIWWLPGIITVVLDCSDVLGMIRGTVSMRVIFWSFIVYIAWFLLCKYLVSTPCEIKKPKTKS